MPDTQWPSEIRVGYRTYVVEVMTPMLATGKDIYGECDNCTGTIRIRADIDLVKSANTMLHEVMHACWYIVNLEDQDKEERVVMSMANQLTQVWRDNPVLITAINARLSGK